MRWLDELGQTLGNGGAQGSLVCCRPWGHEELDTTEALTTNKWTGGETMGDAEDSTLSSLTFSIISTFEHII